jgi:hypothetical protein
MSHQLAGQVASGAQTRVLFLTAVVGSGSVFLIAVISWLFRGYERNLDPSPLEKKLHFVVRLYCALDLALMVGWVALLSHSSQVSDLPLRCIRLLHLLNVIGAAGLVAASYNCYRTWLSPNGDTAAKLEETSIVVAFIVFDLLLISTL